MMPESFDLGRRPFVAEDHRNFGDAQLARGFEAQMAIDDFAVASDQTRDLETEFPDTAAHAIHCRIVLARVSRILH